MILCESLILAYQNIDVLSLSIMQSDLYTCSANGRVHVGVDVTFFSQLLNYLLSQRWSSSFDCTASWQAHDGIVLSSIVTRSPDCKSFCLVTGANDGFVKVS